ncbi:hypothetical protein I4U23_016577 [Adineta vaga]|nr:hypothetical protein I4U23_016577 [Adineta vaga]
MYTTLKSPTRTTTVYNVTPAIFDQLYVNYAETLSCSCSKVNIPYGDFVNHKITFHPICSSIFVSQEWIEALYLKNASRYGVQDFRTTAAAQFQLLASLCLLSQNAVFQNQIHFDNSDFIDDYLLDKVQSQYRVNNTVAFFKNSASTEMVSFVEYLRATMRANYLVSALNTNFLLTILGQGYDYKLYSTEIAYSNNFILDSWDPESMGCSNTNPTTRAGFFEIFSPSAYFPRYEWSQPESSSVLVDGFFTGCIPLDALLCSTLDCLYSRRCLQLLANKFPGIARMHTEWNASALSFKQEKKSVNDHLADLFIEEWSAIMNYSKYFMKCSLVCMLKYRSKPANNNAVCSVTTPLRKYGRIMERLNLFKAASQRTEKDIKQQRISTRLYLVLLTGSLLLFFAYTSWSIEMIKKSEPYPSLSIYNELQIKHLNATLNQFFQSTTDYFGSLIKTEQILTQIDQPYFGPIGSDKPLIENDNPLGTFIMNTSNNVIMSQVFLSTVDNI